MGGIDSGHPGPRPAGALRASKIAPGDFVEPTNTVRCYTLSRRAPSTARPPLHKSYSTQTAQWAGLTRAILALALRARCARPKSLQAILSNPRTRLGVTHFPGVRLRPLGHLSINHILLKPRNGRD